MSCSRTQHSDAGEAQPAIPPSQDKHSSTEPLCSNVAFWTRVMTGLNNFSHAGLLERQARQARLYKKYDDDDNDDESIYDLSEESDINYHKSS